MQKGYVSIHRSLQEHELWIKEKFSKGQAWVDLILLANHKPTTISLRGIDVSLERGQLAWSVLSLSKRWRWNRRTVEKWLKELRNRKMIHTKKSNVTTVITIINYDLYQNNTQQSAQQDAQQSNTKVHTDNNVNNEKNVNKKKQIAKETPVKVKSNGKAKEVIAKFCTLYKDRYGVAYAISGKDGGIAKRLCKHADVVNLLDAYFQSTDKFILDGCHAFNIFESQINKLRLKGGKQNDGVQDKYSGIGESIDAG